MKYVSGQKGYDKIETVRGEGKEPGVMSLAVISEKKVKTHKTGYMTFYEKKTEKLLYTYDKSVV